MVSLLPPVIDTPTPAVPVHVFGGSGDAGAWASATEEHSAQIANPPAATLAPSDPFTKFVIEIHSSGYDAATSLEVRSR
jgi:hypothetical protein